MAKIKDLVQKATADFKKAQTLKPGISKVSDNIQKMRDMAEIAKKVGKA